MFEDIIKKRQEELVKRIEDLKGSANDAAQVISIQKEYALLNEMVNSSLYKKYVVVNKFNNETYNI